MKARDELTGALLGETREELGRADGKASILLSASGLIVSVLLAGAIARDWNPTDLGGIEWLWWVGAAFCVGAIVFLALAVWPRVEHGADKAKVAYFGHVARFGKIDELATALDKRAADSSKGDRDLDQLFMVAAIVDTKYARIRAGMFLLGLGLLLCGLAVTLNYLLA